MTTRADRIYDIIQQGGGRLKVNEVHRRLAQVESVPQSELASAIVSASVRTENKTRREAGRAVRFNVFGDGDEERGWISIREQVRLETSKTRILSDSASQIPALIEEANNRTKEKLKEAIRRLSWNQFESNFLLQILEALGFSSIEITQPTRDGGKDAICRYRRGLVLSEALVSAKHWSTAKVGPDEIQRLRGIRGNMDTGIIFTSSTFTDGAVKEAEPSQNQRSIVLIDGDIIVETCFSKNIGVKRLDVPILYEFANFSFEDEGEE